MKALGRRLRSMEVRAQAQQAERYPSHLIVMPDAWPEEDHRAFEALRNSNDEMAWEDLLERNTGKRPGPGTRVIVLRLRQVGPL